MPDLCFDLIGEVLPTECDKIFIGYSGGVDSQVLLHLCAQNASLKDQITAVYIHHGLQQQADFWGDHCQKIASQLDVHFRSISVNAHPKKKQSPEEAARDARYEAFRDLLNKNDVLLVAQHREDQLETVLLQLFRGAGVQGLAAMPRIKSLGKGKLLRPLLATSKSDIDQYALKNGLQWVEDPSNKENAYDRNFLRNEIIPKLKTRWPEIDKTVARSALNFARVCHSQRDIADDLLREVYNQTDQTLEIPALKELSESKRNLLLRRWFEMHDLKPPSQGCLLKIVNEVMAARLDAEPTLRRQGFLIKRYQNKLYCIDAGSVIVYKDQIWPQQELSIKMANGYTFKIVEADSGIPQKLWKNANIMIRSRQGGEKIKLPGRVGRHTLKNLFQEALIPPWQRKVMPLIYLDGRLAAVAGLWIADEFFVEEEGCCYQINRESNE